MQVSLFYSVIISQNPHPEFIDYGEETVRIPWKNYQFENEDESQETLNFSSIKNVCLERRVAVEEDRFEFSRLHEIIQNMQIQFSQIIEQVRNEMKQLKRSNDPPEPFSYPLRENNPRLEVSIIEGLEVLCKEKETQVQVDLSNPVI